MKIEISKEANLPSRFGNFIMQSFREICENDNCQHVLEHLVIRTKNLSDLPLVRVHSECLTGDALGSLKCDCGQELELALRQIHESQNGMLIYLRQEGRGIGLFNKINAYNLQDQGLDTVEANRALGFKDDEREYEITNVIFKHYNIKEINILTNNPKKIAHLEKYVKVTRSSIFVKSNPHNKNYLAIKRDKLGHLLEENDNL
ncbi:MAG: GTP cyclohydrolase II [Helicobacter sp.]|nr:GTP cyclohydrolase II [Helicobacter sp.]